MSTTVGRLVRTEVVLMRRDPMTLTFVFVFPVVTMLIIGGSFGTSPDPAFDGANPAHWYVASYLTVVIAATGLIMIPVDLASYRERGVLRRFAAAGFPRRSFALAQLVVGLVAIIVSSAILLAVAAPIYCVPALHDAGRVLAAYCLGAIAFVAIGVLLGVVLPSARAAQAVGLLLFFPSFLLGSGGPPPNVMGSALRTISGYLPLTRLTDAVRVPWLDIGNATGSLAVWRRSPCSQRSLPYDGRVSDMRTVRSSSSMWLLAHAAVGRAVGGFSRWDQAGARWGRGAVGRAVDPCIPEARFFWVCSLCDRGRSYATARQSICAGDRGTSNRRRCCSPECLLPRLLLGYATVTTVGITLLATVGSGSSNVAWFALCIVVFWCVMCGGLRVGLVYWAAIVALFVAESLLNVGDAGWVKLDRRRNIHRFGRSAGAASDRVDGAIEASAGRPRRAVAHRGTQPDRPRASRHHRAQSHGVAAACGECTAGHPGFTRRTRFAPWPRQSASAARAWPTFAPPWESPEATSPTRSLLPYLP